MRRLMFMMRNPLPTAVWAMDVNNAEPECGCPCAGCHDTGYTVPAAADGGVPSELRGIYSPEQFAQAKKEIDEIFDTTMWPKCPCGLVHFCIPFSPICAFAWYANRRQAALEAWRDRENARLAPQGLAWVVSFVKRGRSGEYRDLLLPRPLVLTWLPAVRPAYESSHPSERQLMREGLPQAFWLPQDTAAWTNLRVQSPDMPPEVEAERLRLFACNVQRTQMLTAGMPAQGLAQAQGLPVGQAGMLGPYAAGHAPHPQPVMMQQWMTAPAGPQQQSMGAGPAHQPQQYAQQPMQPATYAQMQTQPQPQLQPSAPGGPLYVQPAGSAFARSDLAYMSPQEGHGEGQPGQSLPQSKGIASPSAVDGGFTQPSADSAPQQGQGQPPAAFCRGCDKQRPGPQATMCMACGATF